MRVSDYNRIFAIALGVAVKAIAPLLPSISIATNVRPKRDRAYC
ncbi:MAG TPA: hypothetical protein V6D43_18640 [Candidatus Sericytochromatia bacterium]